MHQSYYISAVHPLPPPPGMSVGKNSSSEHWHYSQLQDDNFEFHGKAVFFLLLLFSIILLIILLFFYARWFCRYLPTTRATANDDHAPPPQGVDTNILFSLPVVLYGVLKKEKIAVECCICIGVFEEEDKVKVLPVCGHCFHSECVDKWLSTQSSCPICRADLRVDSLV